MGYVFPISDTIHDDILDDMSFYKIHSRFVHNVVRYIRFTRFSSPRHKTNKLLGPMLYNTQITRSWVPNIHLIHIHHPPYDQSKTPIYPLSHSFPHLIFDSNFSPSLEKED